MIIIKQQITSYCLICPKVPEQYNNLKAMDYFI